MACNVVIDTIGGWFGSWFITLEQRLQKISIGKTKAPEKVDGHCFALYIFSHMDRNSKIMHFHT